MIADIVLWATCIAALISNWITLHALRARPSDASTAALDTVDA